MGRRVGGFATWKALRDSEWQRPIQIDGSQSFTETLAIAANSRREFAQFERVNRNVAETAPSELRTCKTTVSPAPICFPAFFAIRTVVGFPWSFLVFSWLPFTRTEAPESNW